MRGHRWQTRLSENSFGSQTRFEKVHLQSLAAERKLRKHLM